MVSVSDLRDYLYCTRQPWLHRKIGIVKPRIGFHSGTRFHLLLHSMIERIHKAFKVDIPGKLVDTEVQLARGKLYGRIDVIRKTEFGYIIQEEKSTDPPKDRRVYPEDKLQLDAYAWLAEASPYRPVVSGIIMYNDLVPREVKLEPWRAKETLDEVIELLEKDRLPGVEYTEKCTFCHYYPICQILPARGGPVANLIKTLPKMLERFTGITEGYEE